MVFLLGGVPGCLCYDFQSWDPELRFNIKTSFTSFEIRVLKIRRSRHRPVFKWYLYIETVPCCVELKKKIQFALSDDCTDNQEYWFPWCQWPFWHSHVGARSRYFEAGMISNCVSQNIGILGYNYLSLPKIPAFGFLLLQSRVALRTEDIAKDKHVFVMFCLVLFSIYCWAWYQPVKHFIYRFNQQN